jgi:hypothetical protein
MAVSVPEFEGLNLPSTNFDGVVDRVRSDFDERHVSILPPDLVQRLEARR